MKRFNLILIFSLFSLSVVQAQGLDTAVYNELREEYDYSDQEPPEEKFQPDTTQTQPGEINPTIEEEEESSSWLSEQKIGTSILTLLAIGALIYFIFRLQNRLDNRKVSKLKAATSLEEAEENLLEVHLDGLIADAEKSEDFRMMLHLQFLELLRELHHQELITWKPHKTNGQYTLEIELIESKTLYRKIILTFDRVWYGHKAINKPIFDEWLQLVNKMKQS